MVGWAGATVLLATVDLAQAANTDGLAEVEVTRNGGGANVEPNRDENVQWLADGFRDCYQQLVVIGDRGFVPVDGLRREFLSAGGLDGINPT